MPIEDIVQQFEKGMAHWEITLPRESVAAREGGMIVKSGWTVFYKFGFEGDVEYMDYYASHRMTNDHHARLSVDGRTRGLPSYEGMRVQAKNPEDDEKVEFWFHAYNQAVGELLAEKGFVSPDAHPSHNVNSWLARTPPEEQGEIESSG